MTLFLSPTHEEDALILARAARLFIAEENTAACAELRKLALYDPVVPPQFASRSIEQIGNGKRPNVTPTDLAPVLQRDHWCCRYCGRRLVVGGVLELLGILAPQDFPFPRGYHMPRDRTHPAALRVYPEVDHVHAGARGGDWKDRENLVAACVPCNDKKGDRIGWVTCPPKHESWTGLTELYEPLAIAASADRPFHKVWRRALGL